MLRATAIVMTLCYIALGSGAVERWHNHEHAAEDARAMQLAHDAGVPLDHPPIHDESNCSLHGQIHLSGLGVAWAPLLICLGLFIAFLTLLPSRIVARPPVIACDCRGPPVR